MTRRHPSMISNCGSAAHTATSSTRDDTTVAGGKPTWQPATMTAAEASAALNVCSNTLTRWVRQGRISAYRQGWQWRYLRSEIVGLAAQTADSESPAGNRPGSLGGRNRPT
jgi:excisionase family DNA binding protein